MKLRKELGLREVFCIAIGAMISSGIFVLPGLAHAKAGPSVILSYLLAGLLAAIGMLNAAELATAMPKAGGDYFFITRSLGPALGSVAGLLNWLALVLKSSFALVGMAALARLFVDLDGRVIGIVFCALFVGINLTGAKQAGRMQVLCVAALLALMITYVVRGISHVEVENIRPFMPHGIGRTLSTAGFVFVSYGGLIKILGVAEEIRDPARTIPRGMALALAVVMILYVLMVLVTTGVLPSAKLDNSLTPITEGAATFMGAWGVRAMGFAAILAFVTTANAGIMASSRYLFALSRDELLPRRLSRLSRRTEVPAAALFVTGLFAAAALFLKLDILVEAASLVLIIGFILSCVCVIVLRESRVQNYRPGFRAPLYPILQLAGILGFTLLVFKIGIEAYFICAALLATGAAGYWIYGKKRIRKDYALLHIIERLTSRELITGSLESELKEIIRERDDITTDRFDEIVNRCLVLDIPARLRIEECFSRLAEQLAGRLDLERGRLQQLFIEREKDTSTVLTPFLAVPHIIIPGSGKFEIALVRAGQGVRFSEKDSNVRAVFALVGTQDERNFHLRTLAAIAQIAQEPDFEARWLNARGEQGIRDVVLLGKRMRAPW